VSLSYAVGKVNGLSNYLRFFGATYPVLVQVMSLLQPSSLEITLSITKPFVRLTSNVYFKYPSIIDIVYVSDTSTFTTDIRSQGYYGLLGLGPNSGSVVRKKISKDSRGDTMLTHIFETDNLTDNYISFLLDRKGVPNPPFQGQITISELVPGFENVSSMPQIDIDKVNQLLKAGAISLQVVRSPTD